MRNFVIILATVVLFTTACKQNYNNQAVEQQTDSAVQKVRVSRLTVQHEPIAIEASGIVSSRTEYMLSFKVGGIIDRMDVQEGQSVRKGQQLARLKTTEIDAQVLKAQQAVDKARRDVERIEQLYADTAATLEQVQDLKTALELAEADLKIARFNQNYAVIKAPTTGRILRKFTETNELVNAGTPVFRMGQSGNKGFVIKVGVADVDVIRLQLNDTAVVHFDAYPDTPFDAFVSEIAEAADPRTGVFEIELTLMNKTGYILKNGFIGKLKIYPSRQQPYFKIGMDALVEGSRNKASIYVPSNNNTIARKISIRPEYIGDDYFTIAARQLPDESLVISEGAPYLSEGAKIEVTNLEAIPDTGKVSMK